MSAAGIDPMGQELSNVMEMGLKYQEDCVDGALAQHRLPPSLSLMISLLLIVANISAHEYSKWGLRELICYKNSNSLFLRY